MSSNRHMTRVIIARVYKLAYQNPDSFLTEFICWRLQHWLRRFLDANKSCQSFLEQPRVSLFKDVLEISWTNRDWRVLRLLIHPDETCCQIDIIANRTVSRRYEHKNVDLCCASDLWVLFDSGRIPKSLKSQVKIQNMGKAA